MILLLIFLIYYRVLSLLKYKLLLIASLLSVPCNFVENRKNLQQQKQQANQVHAKSGS